MALTFVLSLITCAICYGIYRLTMWHWRRRRLYELASKFRGPTPLPIIGSAHLLAGDGEHVANTIQNLGEWYPPPFRVWVGPRLFVYMIDPEQIKTVCLSLKALGKGEFAEFSRPLIGEGILTAPAAKWQVHRKLIQPTFNPKILESFVEIFVAQSRIFVEQLEQNLDGPEFNIFNSVGSCTLDMICETAMGVKIGAQLNRNFSFVQALQEVIADFNERFFNIWLHPDIVFYNLKIGKRQKKGIKLLHDFTDSVIQMKKTESLKRQSQGEEFHDENNSSNLTPRKEAFLDHLMKLINGGWSLSDESLREEVNTMVMAGNDTTAIALSHVLLMLASHPEVQEKAYRELHEIYGDEDIEAHPISPKDLPRMKYVDRVIRETMRLFPVSPVLVRSVTEDLDIGDYTIPSGGSALFGIFRLHRDEKYWPDPLKFDPDRFLPEEVAKRHPYTYMAFSNGPRNCIGLNYAMMSMKTFVGTVLRSYVLKKDNIVPIKDIRMKMEILLKMVNPITLRLERRARN